MRIRTIKPEFFRHEGLAELSALHRLLFVGLWGLADKNGCLEDRPKRIKIEVLPWDDCDLDAMLNELAAAGFVVRYEAKGMRLIHIVSFRKHQRISGTEASASTTLPMPDDTATEEASGKQSGSTEETSGKHVGSQERSTGKENGVQEGNGDTSPRARAGSRPDPATPRQAEGFNAFWAAYPRKVGKEDAKKSWMRLKVDDAQLGTILAALERVKVSDQWRRGIIPNPATWLNQRRWEDEPPDAAPGSQAAPSGAVITTNGGKTVFELLGMTPPPTDAAEQPNQARAG